MGETEEGWLHSIAECDDALLEGTLLVYGDWLEEHSDPTSAAIVRDLVRQGFAPLFRAQAKRVIDRHWLRAVKRQAQYRINKKAADRRLQQLRQEIEARPVRAAFQEARAGFRDRSFWARFREFFA